MRPVKPGDLLVMYPEIDQMLIGVVLSHHENVQRGQPVSWEYRHLKGPGVSIYWQTSGIIAVWTYSSIAEEIVAGRMTQVDVNEL